MNTYTQQTVGELVADKPARARVFESFGIDYCCGGKIPLSEACQKKGVDEAEVTQALREADAASPQPGDDEDWRTASMGALVDNIVNTHHDYLKRELPRLRQIVAKVAAVHGERHTELPEVEAIYNEMLDELFSHMMKEEHILFPWIKSVDAGGGQPIHCGTVMGPISVMEHEHDSAGQALARMRDLTAGYTPPQDACNTYRVMLDALRELEADLHIHIHKENNILFPKALEAEKSLLASSQS